MTDLPHFHTPLFRKIGAKLAAEIQTIKDEAVSFVVEPPHAHAERIGKINGIFAVAQFMSEMDKEMAGVEK
ncbi:MAG TPA: hypothetical protein PKX13_12030 [Acidiphilium sp.]|nr:MAG: hypothetical protein B7Z68_00700 [Acidobacteria bacterium 21-70-11]HQU24997.1 hypothetical protein [Acidiphilium sp.]